MTIQASLKTYLGTVSALTAIIGTRLYAMRGPEAVAPTSTEPIAAYAVYRFMDIKDENTLTEAVCGTGQLLIDCYSSNYDIAWNAAEALRVALSFFQGVMGGGVNVRGCARIGVRDEDAPQVGLFKVSSEFELMWNF